MFSFVGDTVVDPFAGTGTTALAALEAGRNSINVEIEPTYVEMMANRLKSEHVTAIIEIEKLAAETSALYPAVAV